MNHEWVMSVPENNPCKGYGNARK